MKFSRRTAMEVLGAGAWLPAAVTPAGAAPEAAQVPAPPKEGTDTPKIALSMGDSGGDGRASDPDPTAGPRKIKQLGVNNVLGGGGRAPWTEQGLNAMMDRWKAAGISVGNLMINLSPDILYGKAGEKRDA